MLPNIVYILADDWGVGDVSCLNPQSKITTPHTDRFASEGVTFTDAHSNSAVCTPTRYGVLTGRYCFRSRLKASVLGGYDDLLIEDGRMTVASLLREQGYTTACIGKWHLGLGWQRRHNAAPLADRWQNDPNIDFDGPLSAGPHTVGFDHSFIIPSSLDIPPYCFIEDGRALDTPLADQADSPRPAFWRAGPRGREQTLETALLEFTVRAEGFINQHGKTNPGQPFFLYFPMPSPHTPHVPRKPFVGSSQCGPYGDYVTEHDASIGRILEAIDRNGLTDNTLVIITSDNGAHMRGDGFDFENQFGHRSNHIYRGQKSDAWDGGHRVPFFARWPGHIPAASTCDHTICLTDLMATVAAITGAELPRNAGEDSFNILPHLSGDADAPARPPVVHHSMTGRFAIRDGHWKLLACPGSGGWSSPDANVSDNEPRVQLYDMVGDPAEQRNVQADHPDVVHRLTALLDEYRVTGRSIEAHTNFS